MVKLNYMAKLKDVITTVRLTPDQVKYLNEIRVKYHQDSISSTIRMAIDNLISEEKRRTHINKK
jgi:hypothetical protein